MPIFTEPVSGGLVTIRDPSFLKPGEISDSRNLVYIPGTDCLHRATGRAVFGTVSASAVNVLGLRDIKFDNGDQYLIAAQGGTRLCAAKISADTGTFAALTSVSATSLEAAHFRNRFYLFTGATQNVTATAVNSQVVAYLSATATDSALQARPHGMVPVNSPPLVTATAATFSQTTSGYYDYWTTEVAEYTQDNAQIFIESTFEAAQGPATQFISATSVATVIQRPTIINPTATRWRIYRSPKKDFLSDKKFPTGFMIADVATAVTSVIDSTSAASASAFAGSFNGVSDGATVWADFSNATAMSQDDSASATAMSTSLVNIRNQGIYNFLAGGASGTLGNVAGPVKGVKVEVVAKVDTGTSQVGVSLVRARQSNGGVVPTNLPSFPGSQSVYGQLYGKRNIATKSFTATTAEATATLGGETDRWFASDNPAPLTDSDINSTSFMVLLSFSDSTTTTLSVDFVRVTVYYGATIDSTVVFPTVAYTFGDIIAQVGKNGPPPSSDTGDVYEDSLIVNDLTNPAVIRYSYPGDPEAFPSTYYIDFETPQNDRVRCIRVVNEKLLVGLDTSLWRVNYLPSERDASFDRGKAKQPVSLQYGIVNSQCACLFTQDGGSQELAFVSHKGIHTTNGYTFQTRTGQLDWRHIIPALSPTFTSNPIALINDPENQRLEFLYQNTETTPDAWLKLVLSYARGDVDDEGNFKASGPVHMRNFDGGAEFAEPQALWAAPRANGRTSIYIGYGGTAGASAAGAGQVYVERGTTIPASDSLGHYASRRIFAAEQGGEWRMDYLWTQLVSTAAATADYRILNLKTNASAEATVAAKVVGFGGARQHRLPLSVGGEGIRVSATITGTTFQLAPFLIEGVNFNREDSGK